MQKNRVALLLNDARHQSSGRGLAEGATDQMQRQVLCWRVLLGRSGNAARVLLGWVGFLLQGASIDEGAVPPTPAQRIVIGERR